MNATRIRNRVLECGSPDDGSLELGSGQPAGLAHRRVLRKSDSACAGQLLALADRICARRLNLVCVPYPQGKATASEALDWVGSTRESDMIGPNLRDV